MKVGQSDPAKVLNLDTDNTHKPDSPLWHSSIPALPSNLDCAEQVPAKPERHATEFIIHCTPNLSVNLP